jgi:hypothetical protein
VVTRRLAALHDGKEILIYCARKIIDDLVIREERELTCDARAGLVIAHPVQGARATPPAHGVRAPPQAKPAAPSPFRGGAGVGNGERTRPQDHCRTLAAAHTFVAFLAACPTPPPPAPPPPVVEACDAGDEAFVREATLAILGRRPFSEAEVRTGARAIAAITTIDGLDAADAVAGRRAFARSLARDPAYVERWSGHLMDALFVPRTGGQALRECYGTRARTEDEQALAAFVRDTAADDGAIEGDSFTYLDLLRSSLVLDDVSPVYRAHLFAMLTRPNFCGNVEPVAQELALRDEIGGTFDAAYLDRDPVCLACHNSEFAVTDRDDLAQDRHWPAFGKLEEAVFGSSFEVDPKIAHGPLRVTGFFGAVDFGGMFEVLDGALAYCFNDVTGELSPASCIDGALPPCPGSDFGAFCLGFLDAPFCAADGTGACLNTPMCVDESFQVFEPATCVDLAVACSNPDTLAVFCGDFVSTAYCDESGRRPVPQCPSPAAEGEGEGEAAVGLLPWGADPVCGSFNSTPDDDIADVDGRLASARGKRATVLDLDKALKRGADALAVRGIAIDDNGAADGPDEAFAALVAMHVVDGVWREIMGSPLTIATHFPRNEAQQQALQALTDRFVRSHWSLEGLIVDIVTQPLFNLPPPDAGCGPAFGQPAVFDPWVLAEPEEAQRNNSAADGVHPLSSRTLLSAAYAALGWPVPADAQFPGAGVFDEECIVATCAELRALCADNPGCCDELAASCGGSEVLDEASLQRGIGVFHGISEKGFRGLDFQARLTWESRFGGCRSPAGPDAITELAARAADRSATVGDAVRALKERLVNEPTFAGDEQPALTALVGDLLRPAALAPDLEALLRTACGAVLSSPQFQLGGIANEGGPSTPLSTTDADACEALASRGIDDYVLDCSEGVRLR